MTKKGKTTTDKKSFILYIDSLEVLDELSDEDAGKLFKAIKQYIKNRDIILGGYLKAIFVYFKNYLERDLFKYKETLDKRAIAGKKGGLISRRGKGKQTEANESKVSKCLKKKAKKPDNVSVSVNDNVSEDKKHKFVFPTLKELFEEINLKNFSVDAEKFFYHYEANGWKVGKNKMKNWKMALASWNAREDKPKVQDNKLLKAILNKNGGSK